MYINNNNVHSYNYMYAHPGRACITCANVYIVGYNGHFYSSYCNPTVSILILFHWDSKSSCIGFDIFCS